jgi:hypothetical protein
MMKRRVSDLSRADVLSFIRPTLRRMWHCVIPDGFFDDVLTSGITAWSAS